MRPRFALLTVLLVCSLGVAPAVTPVTAQSSGPHPCAGTISDQPDELTIVSVQGAKFNDSGAKKTNARVVAYTPNGSVKWVHHSGERYGVVWSYDIDPLPNGNLFITGTQREDGEGKTVLYELDAETGEPVWSDQIDMLDTHDADMLNRTHIVIANMRAYDEESETNNDRLAIYNRSSGEIEWSWYFRDHYDRSVGGKYTEDWTHVNDVDKVGKHHFLASPRNFDQAILVNRTSGEIDLKLGKDGDLDTLYKQHNPDYLAGEDGTATFLVADSENDRIVEYAWKAGEWDLTWSVGDESTLAWPRDADRLPNGNTLLGDSRNDRVLEVTPEGEVVWEVYAPYLVYDVERVPGDGSRGPTMADEGTTGEKSLTNAEPPSEATLEPCAAAIDEHEGGWGEDLRGNTGDATGTATTWGEATVNDDDVMTARGEGSSVFGSLGVGVALAAIAVAGAVLAVRSRRD